MKSETRDELILKHLDGDTSPEESVRLTKLLAEDETFRSRFFTFVHQASRIREYMEPDMNPSQSAAPHKQPGNGVAATKSPARRIERPADERSPFDLRRIYFNAVLGGIGGLLGWTLMSVIGWIIPYGALHTYVRAALIGPLIGVGIGFMVGGTEGIVASQSLRRFLRGSGFGAAFGALGGLLGLVLGEFIFNLLGGGVWARSVGWSLFGILVGASDGFAQNMPAKIRYGVLGGLLGGFIGGSTYEALSALLLKLDTSLALGWGNAIGLILLGACIGALMGLVEALLRQAWVFFLTGRLEGQTRTLDSGRTLTVGSDPSCSIIIPNDDSVAGVHAEFAFIDGQFVVRARDGVVRVRRETQEKEVKQVALAARDRISLGQTRMIFRTEEAKKK